MKNLNYLIVGSFLIIAVFYLPVMAQAEAEKQGKEIFEKYQAAIGGKENLAKIKNAEIISESDGATGKKKTIEIFDKVTKKNYVGSDGDTGKIEMGSDGNKHWMRRGGQADYINFTPAEETIKYVKLPNETLNGQEYLVLEEVKSNTRGNAKSFYYPETLLLARRENLAGLSSSTTKIIKTFADYRKVGDVLVPFLETSTNDFSGTTTKKILSVRHNIEIDPKVFEIDGPTPKIENISAGKPQNNQPHQPIVFNANKNSVYKDENDNLITQAVFKEKQFGANYLIETEVSDGKMIGLKLKKGNLETAIGAIPPDFTAIGLDNSAIQLSQLKGKIVVLNFWFIECAPCIKEMPELNELVKKYEGKNVEFLAITHNPKNLVTDFFKNRKFDYKQIVEAQNIVASYKATSYPTHIVLNQEGKILFTQLGYNNKIIEQMTKLIDSALASN